jgi:hypothetical protein
MTSTRGYGAHEVSGVMVFFVVDLSIGDLIYLPAPTRTPQRPVINFLNTR